MKTAKQTLIQNSSLEAKKSWNDRCYRRPPAAFTARSLNSHYKWVTCPYLLERFQRDCGLAGVTAEPIDLEPFGSLKMQKQPLPKKASCAKMLTLKLLKKYGALS